MPRRFLRVRMGVYAIEPGCLSASAAIDEANFARKQVHSNTRVSAVQFDKKLEVKQTLTGELLSGLPQALENGEFKLYLQPKFSPKDSLGHWSRSADPVQLQRAGHRFSAGDRTSGQTAGL